MWGPGTAPLGRGFWGGPLARTGTHLRAGAVAGPHTHAVLGGGVVGARRGQGLAARAAAPVLLSAASAGLSLPPPSCNLAGKRGSTAASTGPWPFPLPPAAPTYWWHRSACWRPPPPPLLPPPRLPPQAGRWGRGWVLGGP